MTISEYELFGASNRSHAEREQFLDLVRGELVILRHSYGDNVSDVQSRTMHARWELEKYERSGDRMCLVRAAAWMWAEWMVNPVS